MFTIRPHIVFLITLTFCAFAHARILVMTYAYNRPEFIEIQHKTLQHFMLDKDYDFVPFVDAREEPHISKIKATCEKLNLRCITIPQEIHNKPYLKRQPGEDLNAPAVRNANAVQYSLNALGYTHDDIVVLLDSDLFLVKPFSIRQFMNGYDVAGLKQSRAHIEYLWIGIAFLDMRTLPNKTTIDFNCGVIDSVPVDAGGYTYHYLHSNPGLRVRSIGHFTTDSIRNLFCDETGSQCANYDEWLASEGFDGNQITFLRSASNLEFLEKNSFLHYRGGTNWDYQDAEYHRRKTEALNQYIASITHSEL